jgi:hypothetical protein
MATITKTSNRSHLFHFYPLLLEVAFSNGPVPSMWLFPSEYRSLFVDSSDHADADGTSEIVEEVEGDDVDARDGADLIEISVKDLARRCLELVGSEMGMNRGQ